MPGLRDLEQTARGSRYGEIRRISIAPIVLASRFDHCSRSRQRVTCALPAEPIRMRSSRLGFRLRRSIIEGQFLDRLKLSPPRKVNESTNDPDRASGWLRRCPEAQRALAHFTRALRAKPAKAITANAGGVHPPGAFPLRLREPARRLLRLQRRCPLVPDLDLLTIRIFYKCKRTAGTELAAPQKPSAGPLDGLARLRQVGGIREPEAEVTQRAPARG